MSCLKPLLVALVALILVAAWPRLPAAAATVEHCDMPGGGSVAVTMPNGWHQATKVEQGGEALYEYLAEGDEVENWDRMITVRRVVLPAAHADSDASVEFANLQLSLRLAMCETVLAPVVFDNASGHRFERPVSFDVACAIKDLRNLPGEVYLRAVEAVASAIFLGGDRRTLCIVQDARHFGELGQPPAEDDILSGVDASAAGRRFLRDNVTSCPKDARDSGCGR